MKQTEGMTSSSESWQDKLDELTPEQQAVICKCGEMLRNAAEIVKIVNERLVKVPDALRKLLAEADEIEDNKEGEQQDEDS